MPTKTFPLEKDGPARLEIEWQGNYKDIEVRLDGVLLGAFKDGKELKAGRTFRVEDGSRLEVALKTPPLGLVPELSLTRDGAPLPGSAADPAQRVQVAASMVFFIAGLNAVLGLVAAAFNVQFLQSIGLGLGSIVVGAIYGVLGYFVKRRSMVALGLAVGLFVLDGVAMLAFAPPGQTPPVGGIVARFFLLVPMAMGFPALRALRAEEERARRAPRPRPAARPAAAGPSGHAEHPGAASPPPAARTFSGEAERRRLELSQTASATATRTAPSGHRSEVRTKSDADAAASGLRFVAHKCEITPAGLKVTYPNGRSRDVPYASIAALVVRLLPPDPPWNAQPLLDAVVRSPDDTAWQAVRVFSTTVVNTAALPGGGSTSRLENVRKLAAHLLARHPALSLDPETAAFVREGKPPARFVNTTHFAEYDQRYA
jgi:hypothetical protein